MSQIVKSGGGSIVLRARAAASGISDRGKNGFNKNKCQTICKNADSKKRKSAWSLTDR